MLDCQPSHTPVDTSFKICAHGEPFSDATLYRSLTGALQYRTITRLEMYFAFQQACLCMIPAFLTTIMSNIFFVILKALLIIVFI
jgi:hypothetical protein